MILDRKQLLDIRYWIFVVLLILLAAPALQAQEAAEATTMPAPTKYGNTLTLVAGVGYNRYINDLKNLPPDAKVYSNRYAASFKLYWEPLYRVKFGIESGFYSVYKVKGTYYDENGLNPQEVKSYLNVIPLYFSVSTRVWDELYATVGVGWADMIYGNSGLGNDVGVSQFSLEDYSFSLSYYVPVNQNLKLGIETTYMKIGKTEDDMISAQFSLMYKIFRW